MVSNLRKLISSRAALGRSLFATFAVLAAVAAVFGTSGHIDHTHFTAGPLDDTIEYLLELLELLLS